MRSYVPNTENERRELLEAIGLDSMEALFADIPQELRLKRELDLGAGMSEAEVRRVFEAYAANTRTGLPLFRGAGAYNHYIPAVIPHLLSRSEFYTAYTPYQAEMSQGMLQGIFEYQTLMCELTGLDVSNASVYDGATAAAEAMFMLRDAKRKRKVLVSAGLHPEVRLTMATYAHANGVELVEIPLTDACGTDMDALSANMEGAAGYICACPNFYGCIEDMNAVADKTHELGGLFVSYVNPISLGALKRPGDYGADIAVGDAQPLGMPLSFGGPYCGFMCATNKLMRNLPGRIVGQTRDADGGRVFVLTLQAREQHIRRDKASSNICSNQTLCALAAAMYLSAMGPEGMAEVAELNMQKARYLADGIARIPGATLRYPQASFFNEFVVDFAKDSSVVSAALKAKGYVGGLRLAYYDKEDGGMLFCATEQNFRSEIDGLILALEEVLR
ncbi:MAG: aminomethyl-transferring glycine dehydrogenase subunit GcvPA [Clostridia bacterium]|nr:aminomethyl-transferring glycine dehydrogenase subunit GcvPA [Clostridia bacterium]